MPKMTNDVLSWATDLEDNTREQAERAASMPFVKKPLALMPDAHLGMGATIGSVIATKGAVIPAAVGVDLGCGMIATRTVLSADDLPDDLGGLHSNIERSIPAGQPKKGRKWAGSHREPQDHGILETAPDYLDVERAGKQFGTLGGGNHFVELCLDDEGWVWVVLHSGSRGAGNIAAKHHIGIAKGIMKDYFIDLPDPDLAYLVEGTPQFEAYIADMLWAQDYAFHNRQAMMDAALEQLGRACGQSGQAPHDQPINCHHNYCTKEHHHGQNLWVTRKGAISARAGQLGVIPGSMATGSFIVEGKGSPASYMSASHGAGRRMSRSRARRELEADTLNDHMQGIAWNDDAEGLLDEHPHAYKDLGEVMDNQADLVAPVARLTTILNYKGA